MILQKIENYNKFPKVNNRFEKALDFIFAHKNGDLNVGKYDVCEGVFVNVQEYETRPASEKTFESHRKYIDLFYIVSGEELVEWNDISEMTFDHYDEGKDRCYITGAGMNIPLKEGYFMVLFPEDAHKPSVQLNESEHVKKYVVKIAVDPE